MKIQPPIKTRNKDDRYFSFRNFLLTSFCILGITFSYEASAQSPNDCWSCKTKETKIQNLTRTHETEIQCLKDMHKTEVQCLERQAKLATKITSKQISLKNQRIAHLEDQLVQLTVNCIYGGLIFATIGLIAYFYYRNRPAIVQPVTKPKDNSKHGTSVRIGSLLMEYFNLMQKQLHEKTTDTEQPFDLEIVIKKKFGSVH